MDTPLLIVFTRNPVKGKVKTRLAASTNEDFALNVYRKLRERTRLAAFESGADLAVYYTDYLPENDIFYGSRTQTFLQKGRDLGSRMLNAFTQGFSDSYQRIILVGTDCPDLTGELLSEAFELLLHKSALLGPATDGGYYLIGMRSLLPELFIGKQWSTSTVCREAIAVLKHHSVDYSLLPTLPDIDTIEDLGNFNLS